MSAPRTAPGMRLGLGTGWPAWAIFLVALGASLVAVCAISEAGAFGHGPAQAAIGVTISLALTVVAAVAATAAAWVRRDPSGWGLIAAALVANAGGELYFEFGAVDPVAGPYPSPADLLYLGFYVLAILGLRNIARRAGAGTPPVLALLTPLLGLATLWSLLVLEPVLGTLEGDIATRITTASYPFLDLLLVCAALFALAASEWRLGRSLLLLASGVVIIGIADSIFAAQVATESVPEQNLIDSLWPAGAFLIALSPWTRARATPGDRDTGPHRGTRLELAFAVPAVCLASGALVLDHFEPLSHMTLVLAAATLVAAAARLVGLYLEVERARRQTLRAERARARIENLHTASAQTALEAIITVDGEGRVVDWNPAAGRIFGYAEQEALGEVVSELIVPPSIRDEYDETFARFSAGRAQHLSGRRTEMTGMRSDGTEIPVELAVARIGTDPPLFTAFVADITERKQREVERERLASMVRSAEDAMYSTDRDLIVIAWNPAAERIFGFRADEIVGTKFERLVPADKRDELKRLAETVAAGEAVSAETTRLRSDGELIDVSVQVYPVRDELGRITGYSSVARDITDRRRREREQRLHRERAAWRGQIEDALDQDGFEFHRQPVLDLRSGRISHHELLLRMRLDGDLVPPGRFLPYAESSAPLIRRIDRWAIRRGIELAAERPVAINLSAKSLSDAGIAKAVQSELERSGAEPRDVIFEITETAAAEQLEDAHALVAALRALGCGVALDDFGTGYGSFTYLLRMPVTSLKIDMEFIRALSDDPADQRVVGSILAVAQNFGLTTVAEGVERESTLRLLGQMGVDEIQGYLVGRPQPDWTDEATVAEMLASTGMR